MKLKYTCKDNLVEVTDSNIIGANLSYDYKDNIHEILVIENIIEYLEKYEKELCDNKEKILLKKDNYIYLNKISKLLSVIMLFSGITSTLFQTNMVITLYFFFLSAGLFHVSYNILSDKINLLNKTESGIDYELNSIEEKLKECKKNCKELNNNKSNIYKEIDNNKTFKVVYLNELKKLKEYLKETFYLGLDSDLKESKEKKILKKTYTK